MQPLSSGNPSSFGIAMISLYLSCVACCPSTDHVQGIAVAFTITRAFRRLAVDGDHFTTGLLHHGMSPTHKTLPELLWRQPAQSIGDTIVRGHAVLKRYILAQPIELFFAELFNRLPTIGATGHRADAQNNDIG